MLEGPFLFHANSKDSVIPEGISNSPRYKVAVNFPFHTRVTSRRNFRNVKNMDIVGSFVTFQELCQPPSAGDLTRQRSSQPSESMYSRQIASIIIKFELRQNSGWKPEQLTTTLFRACNVARKHASPRCISVSIPRSFDRPPAFSSDGSSPRKFMDAGVL